MSDSAPRFRFLFPELPDLPPDTELPDLPLELELPDLPPEPELPDFS